MQNLLFLYNKIKFNNVKRKNENDYFQNYISNFKKTI